MNRSEVTYTIKDSIIVVYLPTKIDFSISNHFSEILEVRINKKIEVLLFDFEETNFVTLPGALYIITFSIVFTNNHNRFMTVQMKNLNPNIIRFFMSIGLFSKLTNRAGLQVDKKIIEEEQKINSLKISGQNSVIFPITSILYNSDKSYFQSFTKWFVDNFRVFFYSLAKYPKYNYLNDPDDFQEMYEAAYEIIKNIFDHSESEGFGAIHASSYLEGTTMAFFDMGIGVSKSVSNSKKVETVSDIEAIDWALKDGNSSKINGDNQGHGFTILKEFCDNRNGILTIRTGKQVFIYKNKKWDIKSLNFFPGTQVVIYNPTVN